MILVRRRRNGTHVSELYRENARVDFVLAVAVAVAETGFLLLSRWVVLLEARFALWEAQVVCLS